MGKQVNYQILSG